MMNGWFLTLIILNVLNLGVVLSKHGEPREGKHEFWSSLIGSGLTIALIYMAIYTGF